MESPRERALREIEEVFGDRLKRGPAPPGDEDALGSERFFPVARSGEVLLLSIDAREEDRGR